MSGNVRINQNLSGTVNLVQVMTGYIRL